MSCWHFTVVLRIPASAIGFKYLRQWKEEEKKGIHGLNEALRYDCLPGAVDFYKNLIRDNH